MEYLAATVSAAQSLLGALQSSELKELCSVWEYESELEKLECTMKTIKAMLLDAESKQEQGELSNEAQSWVDQLKLSVYDADDLLDEFTTIAEQKLRRAKEMKGDCLGQKVRRFFSFDNPLLVALRLSQGVKEIRNKLDSIDHDYNRFGFKLDHQPIRRRREETCSYVHEPNIVGREGDQEKVVGMLLDPNVQQSVSCLSIVGIGGLGKTTLAQLVYNDPRIKENFPLRVWTCVSDQDLKHLDVKATLCKILQSATGENCEYPALDPLVKRLRELLEGKKYLLVLDDLWNENRRKWHELIQYLMTDVRGTWILVTTRSEETATIVEDEHIYKLKGLTEEDSWRLFEMTVFGERYVRQDASDKVEIGRDIVKRCANVPLAIRVVGTLLYGQGTDKWLRFRKIELGRLKDGKDEGIGPILKFSYDHLDPPLKACFSYCALFPKDHVIDKEMLINLWMAQDYIASQEGQSVEDVGEEYFSILLKRCFFQDVKKDRFGEIISCKIHDLMHDIAQEVSGEEVCTVNLTEGSLHNKTRHISFSCTDGSIDFQFKKTKIRTCIRISYGIGKSASAVDMLLRNWKCLRVLDLRGIGVQSLPSELVTLLHLRYLDLSHNSELKLLPNSFSKLLKLQTLSLQHCHNLKELPKDLPELAKLRVLDITGCSKISMPKGLGKLTNLTKMPLFVAGNRFSSSERSVVNEMEELKALTNLKGSLCIVICENAKYATANVKEGGYIKDKENLNCLRLRFFCVRFAKMARDEQGLLLEDLRPPCNLRELTLHSYHGMSMPSWAKEEDWSTFLPNLVKLELYSCRGWQHLPSLRKLPNLKSLSVSNLSDLEYIENTSSKAIINGGVSASDLAASFPSLQELKLEHLYKLKGWWRDDDDIIDCDINEGQQHLLTSFPSLSKLTMHECPNFTCVITCPNVEEMELTGISQKLRIMIPIESGNPKLRSVRIPALRNLKSILPTKAFQCVPEMSLRFDIETESLSEVEEVFRSCSSLRKLWIRDFEKLKSVSGGLEYLTALEDLSLKSLPSLSLGKAGEGEGEGEGENEEEDDMPWHCLGHSLRELSFNKLPKLVHLPKGMCYLTALESLHIENCEGLESLSNAGKREGEGEQNDGLPWRCLGHSLRELSFNKLPKLVHLPKGMCYLTALESLHIENCEGLESLSNAGKTEGEGEQNDGLPWRCLGHNLRSLVLHELPKLVNLPKGICYLTALKSLSIGNCEGLESLSNAGEREGEGEENDGLPWRCLGHNLRQLNLYGLPKLFNLPKGMRYLTALKSLNVSRCPALESLPESMRELTSLEKLAIVNCSDSLKERCRENTGEDWPNIQHIHQIDILMSRLQKNNADM